MKKIFFFTVLCLHFNTQAQTRQYSNEFLNIGVDAAAFGMGNTVVAQTNDVTAGYWNPAGLLQLKTPQASLMHANYFANIASYDYIGYAMPLDDTSAFGVSLIRFGVDDILDTTQLIDDNGIDYNRINLFSAADYAFTFSYAKDLGIKNLRFGANAKIIRRLIGDFANSWGFGFDAGIQYDYKSWKFGLVAKDITTTFNTWSIDSDKLAAIQQSSAYLNSDQEQEVPEDTEITLPKLQLGVAKTFYFKNKLQLLTELDANMRFAETNDIISSKSFSIAPSFGMQLNYNNIVFLRSGIGHFQEETGLDNNTKLSMQPNIGLGFQYRGVYIDYALTNIGKTNEVFYSNIFSLKIDWSVFNKKQ